MTTKTIGNNLRWLLVLLYVAMIPYTYGEFKAEYTKRNGSWTQTSRFFACSMSLVWPVSLTIIKLVQHAEDEASW